MLRVENVWVSYKGEASVLKGVSLELGAHEVVALLGANGAGKSTLLRTMSGLIPCQKGRIFLDGEEITRLPPHSRVRLGLVHVPEGRQMLAGMTVDENINLGGYGLRHNRPEFLRSLDEVYELFPVLKTRRNQSAGSLSGGEQQMVAIGRALMAKPRVLLCDEPSFGLAPLIVRDIFQVLASLRGRGIPILLVEQNAAKALELSDRGLVMRNGEIVFTGSAKDLKDSEKVKAAYLGIAGASTPDEMQETSRSA